MEILSFFENIRNPVLTAFFSLVTHFGEEYLFIIIALSVYWCINKKCGYCILFTGIIGQTVNQVLKLIFEVDRPWIAYPELNPVKSAIENAGGYSFPSGHTQVAATTYGTLAYFYRSNRTFSIFMIALTVLVALSRMYLGVHYLSDVLFSLLFGLFVVLLSGKLIEMGVSNSVFRVTSVVFAVVMLLVVLLSTDFSNITEYSSFTLDASSKFFGGILGFAVSWLIEEKYIKFETKGSLIFQILKVVLGVAGVLLLRTLLKLVFF